MSGDLKENAQQNAESKHEVNSELKLNGNSHDASAAEIETGPSIQSTEVADKPPGPTVQNSIFKSRRHSSFNEQSVSFIGGRRGSIEKRGSDAAGDAAIVEKLSNIPIHVRGRAEAWEIPRSQLQLSSKLGAGAGSVVFKCRWRGLDCAAKLLSDRNPTARDSGVYQEMVNEISIISHLRHPNLVLFLGACTVGSEPLVILSEYMAGGSLEDRFKVLASGSSHR